MKRQQGNAQWAIRNEQINTIKINFPYFPHCVHYPLCIVNCPPMTTTALQPALIEVAPHDSHLLRDIWNVRAACAHDLHNRFGEGHWAQVAPLLHLRRVAEKKHVYAVRRANRTVATFVLSRIGPSFLRPRYFHDPAAPAAFLTALAVLPEYQGHGLGRWCMQQAEAIARQWGCQALRFDAYDHPAGAWAFYDRGGYQRRAKLDVYGVPLIAYERVL